MSSFVKKADDRVTTRRAVRGEVQVVEEQEFVLLAEDVVDLSEDGMLVASDAVPPIGTTVFVSFQAPGTDTWIDTEATVARISRGRRGGKDVRGLGLRFGAMSDESRAALATALIGRPPPVPGRHLRRDYAETVRIVADSEKAPS
jgi:hypothetical protein